MIDKISEWDAAAGAMVDRDMTPSEQAELDARRVAGMSIEEHNAPILEQLIANDMKTIRALREGNQERVDEYEAQAKLLRAQLRKE